MPDFYSFLKIYIDTDPPNFGDRDSILTLLYEAFAETNPMDDGQLKQDFHEFYELMNGMPLRDLPSLYPLQRPSEIRLCSRSDNWYIAGIRHITEDLSYNHP